MKLVVATCQFPVSADVYKNADYVLEQMQEAKDRGARVAHFCEGSLSGYPGVDFRSFVGFDWAALRQCSSKVLDLARRLRLWVLLGSSHPLCGRHKPHNSVYIINSRGKIIDRYDKRFCAGDRSGRTGELAHYSPGNHPSLFTVCGIRCGVLICHEFRYPELYREYKRKGAQLIFHSFHAGNMSPQRRSMMRAQVGAAYRRINPSDTLPGITMPASMHAAAGSNHVWISCSNTSAKESCWPSFFMRPDGVITGKLRQNTAGVLVSTVDPNLKFYDSTAPWRDRAMRGQFHSGVLVRDKRSACRTAL